MLRVSSPSISFSISSSTSDTMKFIATSGFLATLTTGSEVVSSSSIRTIFLLTRSSTFSQMRALCSSVRGNPRIAIRALLAYVRGSILSDNWDNALSLVASPLNQSTRNARQSFWSTMKLYQFNALPYSD